MPHRGRFKPLNPEKYRGDPANIIYRSGLEWRAMRYFDSSPSVVWWASEEIAVPYWDPVKKRQRRYFPDFVVCRKNSDGTLKKTMIEVKMAKETIPPVHKPRKRRWKIVQEELTYKNNEAKWAAAKSFCAKHGWTFKWMTERDLG